MKRFFLLILVTAFIIAPNSLFAQRKYSINLAKDIIHDKNAKLKKITKYYEYSIPFEDSLNITSAMEDGLLPKVMEYYNNENQLTRVEHYEKDGTIRDAYNIHYKDGKIAYKEFDSSYGKPFNTRVDYIHLSEDKVKFIYSYKKGKEDKFIYQYDCNDNVVAEYLILKDSSIKKSIDYTYDLNGNKISATTYKDNKEHTKYSYTMYDDENKKTKWMGFNARGELHYEVNYTYPSENKHRAYHIDYKKNTKKYSNDIYFKDDQGNLYKRYMNSIYNPDTWKVTNYKIEYQ